MKANKVQATELSVIEERIKKCDNEFHSFPSKETWAALKEAKNLREEILRKREMEACRQLNACLLDALTTVYGLLK